ncbi:MAG TPA: hypothetical protein VN939_13015 [Chthoniobacterales bacterium]|nr:hypothetical protein [Chthoniobacterales bacterium]
MKTEVYRAYCTAGTPIIRTRETPVKMVTIQFPDEVLRRLPPVEAQRKAIDYANELLQNEILNDPNFKAGFGWEARKEEVDLSDYEYCTPNMQRAGAKVWLN